MTAVQPVARTHLMIRQPVAEVFEAFVDPRITTRFWFTGSTGRVEEGARLTWTWSFYDASAEVEVVEVEKDRRIVIAWPTPVEWKFTPLADDRTFVEISASGFAGDAGIDTALDSMGGFTFLLAGCKAWLEHGIELRLVEDHDPRAHSS